MERDKVLLHGVQEQGESDTPYDEFGMPSGGELAAAFDAGKVEKLPGFGKKTAATLRRAIEHFTRHAQRFLLTDADELIQPLWRVGWSVFAEDGIGLSSRQSRQAKWSGYNLHCLHDAICESNPPNIGGWIYPQPYNHNYEGYTKYAHASIRAAAHEQSTPCGCPPFLVVA
jgi:hypothetical protein